MDPLDTSEKAIFLAALEQTSDEAREAYLEGACRGDAALRARLQELLDAHQADSGPLDQAAVTIESTQITEKAGVHIGPYVLREQIGEGGMGVVFVAEQQTPIARKVAIKIIKPGMDTKEVVSRFEAERQALAIMSHPNIAKVLDAGETDSGHPFFVMELVRGIPITEYCDRCKSSVQDRLKLFADVCLAVQHAHQKGVIHRDVKPSNILVTEHDGSPVVKVIDFGVAKAINQRLTEHTIYTKFQQMIGTPMYMSPEQAELSGLDVDTRSDVYSLGVLLYELVTGTTPFDANSFKRAAFDEIRRIIREEDPPKPSTRISTLGNTITSISSLRKTDPRRLCQSIRGDLDWIVMKCLEKDRTRRYATASDLAADVMRHLDDEPIQARPPSTLYRMKKFASRNYAAMATAALVSIAVLLGLVISTWQAIRATRAETRLADAHERVTAQRDRAIRAEGDAKRDRDRAIASEQLAADQANQLRRRLYVFHISRAADAYEHRDFAKMREYLDQCPEDLRHWEWDRLNRLDYPRELFTLHGGELPLFTSDGQHILSADFRESGAYGQGDRTNAVVVWNANSGERLGQLAGHQAHVASLALSADNQRLATCDVKGEMILWDLGLGLLHARLIHRWKAHDDKSDGLAFSPDGTKIASVGWDGWVKMWDATNAHDGQPLFAQRTGVRMRGVCFDADGSRLATSCENGDETTIWDATTGEVMRRLRSDKGAYGAVAFSPQGELLAIGNGDNIEIWDTLTWERIRVLRGHTGIPRGVAFRPQGDRLVSCAYDANVILWDVASGKHLTTLDRHSEFPQWLSFSPDGKRVASFGRRGIRVWDAAFRSDVLTLRGHEVHPHALALSANQRLLVSAGCDGTVKLWDAASGIEVRTLHSDGERLMVVAVDRDGELIAAAGDDGPIFVWQGTTGQIVARLRGHKDRVTSLSFRPSSPQLASASADDTIRIWDLRTGKSTRTLDHHNDDVSAVAFAPDGERLASAGRDKKLYLWNSEFDQPKITISDSSDDPETVAFSPDGSQLATGSRDGAIAIYDTQTGERLSIERGGADREVAFSADGKRLFSAGTDRAIRVWSTSDGEQLLTLRGHDGAVEGLVVMRDGTAIVSASRDGTIKVWEAGIRKSESFLDRDGVEQAGRIVDQLYEEHRFLADVVKSLRADQSLDSSTRSVALQIANARGERAWTLNGECLAVVREPGHDLETYQRAVREAEAACRVSPESWRFLPTLGMALYRAGDYERALTTLQQADSVWQRAFDTTEPKVLAFTAMTLHRLGRSDASRVALEKAVAYTREDRWSNRLDLDAYLAEAQKLVDVSPQSED